MRTKKGDTMAVIQLEDWEGIVEVLLFPDTYAKSQRLLEADAAIIVKGKLDNDESSIKILATDVIPMERARELLSRTVTVQIDAATAPAGLAEELQPIIDRKKGSAELVFAITFPQRYTAYVRPNPYVKVLPDPELIQAIEQICGPNTVSLQ
jgi:DNA polymerase-3 subunit alpha